MKKDKIVRFSKGLWNFFDVPGWQKWFGAAVLGFAFVLGQNRAFSFFQFQGLIIGVLLILCYIQSVNDCFDVEIDEVKKEILGKELIVSSILSRRAAFVMTFLVLLIGIVSALINSLMLCAIVSAMALLGTLYSAPPFRLKMRYPFSTLTQFAGCFLPFLAGVASFGTVTFQAAMISSIFAFLAMVHRLQHEIANYEADVRTRKRTIAVVNGLRTTEILRKLFAVAGIVEFAIFFALGWFNTVFLLLFFLYLMISIAPVWLRWVPKSTKNIFSNLPQISSFVLLIAVLVFYGRF